MHIDNYYPKERYQADTVNLSECLVSDKRYLLTKIDNFTNMNGLLYYQIKV